MPLPDDATRLRHILESARKAVRFAAGKRHSEDLVSDEVLFLAIVHLLGIIGEAAAGVSDEFKTGHPETPWRQMTATRNRLIHGYFDVEPRLVWETVVTDLPVLIKRVQAVIEGQAR